ncbi:hypothetical protein [Pseudotamlana agarivorans]|uniref:hypothetical protein n=1 Tax=Pseudotamlana agarivorans TaxID=481183 RepID=UPI000834F756|nr:hypothetical protein [Tamlana agarivorans]
MNIDNTADFLEKFDYKYERKGKTLTIIMDYSHRIFMDFKNPNKIIIKDELVTWNFITGVLKMSIRRAILLNLMCNIVLSAIIAFFNFKIGITVFFLLALWTTYWSVTHISKYENLKHILTHGNNSAMYSIES